MLVILSVNESSHFFFYFVTGAVHFFKQMNIGTLKIGDYLGTLNSNILSLSLFLSYMSIICITFSCLLNLIHMIAAIGAIFAATDSVCTLQV